MRVSTAKLTSFQPVREMAAAIRPDCRLGDLCIDRLDELEAIGQISRQLPFDARWHDRPPPAEAGCGAEPTRRVSQRVVGPRHHPSLR